MKYLLLLLITSVASAGVPVASVGIGKNAMYHNGTPFERAIEAGYQFEWGDFYARPEIGGFFCPGGPGNSSLYGATLFGVRALSSVGPELHVGFGPEYLVSPDGIELSGHFQVALEGGIGISDAKSHIGLTWRHTSNSGIELPNLGRDFVMIQVRFYK